jgi:hypothetical protein
MEKGEEKVELYRLKHGRQVARALKKEGFFVKRYRPTVKNRFESIRADKIVNIEGRDVVIKVDYYHDGFREKCEVYGAGVFKSVRGEVTGKKVLKTIGEVEEAISVLLSNVDAVEAEHGSLKEVCGEVESKKFEDMVILSAYLLREEGGKKRSVGDLSFILGTRHAVARFDIQLPAEEYKKVLRVVKKIAKAVKSCGYEFGVSIANE